MKAFLILLLFVWGVALTPLQADTSTGNPSNSDQQDFKGIIVKVMNRGLNAMMAASGVFIFIYCVYTAVSVSFGTTEASAFIRILLGSIVVFSAQAIAKIYYVVFS